MSTPIQFCLVAKAANGDELAFQRLLTAMRENLKCGHWSQWPCKHDPKCTASEESIMAMSERLATELEKDV